MNDGGPASRGDANPEDRAISGSEPLPTRADAVRSALKHLLRPVVRLCVRSGVTFPTVADLLRELFVNVVEHDFALPAKQQTDSRVSLLTGIHRKEVRRLRGRGAPRAEVPKALSRTGRILARWLAAPEFLDATGAPRALPLTSSDGTPSFESLVAGVTRDIRARAVLDDWLDRQLVAADAEGRLVLKVDAQVPKPGDERQLYFFSRNLHDHLAAAVDNVTAGEAPFLERAVHYDGLSAELAHKLEKRAREIALAALQTANREAHQESETDSGGTFRWNFGLYVYTADMASRVSSGPSEAEREQ